VSLNIVSADFRFQAKADLDERVPSPSMKRQQKDLTRVLRRSVEVTSESGCHRRGA